MKYKLDFKLILSSAAIAILAAGCQFSSPGNAVSQNNPTQDATDTSAQTEVAQSSEKWSDLNLTDAQKAQMKQIREQTKAKIVTLLSADQQTQFKTASQGTHESSMKVLRSLNLSKEQKQQVRQIMRDGRQQIQAILTPEQQAKMKEHRGAKEEPSS